MNYLSLLIKTARLRSGLTLREAEEKSGVSNAYINQIENRKIKSPSPEVLLKLSRLYDIPFEVLLFRLGQPVPDKGIESIIKSSGPMRILVADDSAEDRELIIEFLKSNHNCRYDFFEAETGNEALNKINSSNPACIILDYSLPDMSGLDILRKMKTGDIKNKIPVIMNTGQGCEDIALEAMELGAVNYVIKGGIDQWREELVYAVNTALYNKIMRDLIESGLTRNLLTNFTSTDDIAAGLEYIIDIIDRISFSDAASAYTNELLNIKARLIEVSNGINGK